LRVINKRSRKLPRRRYSSDKRHIGERGEGGAREVLRIARLEPI